MPNPTLLHLMYKIKKIYIACSILLDGSLGRDKSTNRPEEYSDLFMSSSIIIKYFCLILDIYSD